jgi:hypothetical protein
MFWDHFCIKFSDYGKMLFGVQKFCDGNNVMAVSLNNTGAIEYTAFDQGYVINLATSPTYIPLTYTAKIVSSYPLLKNLDHRYYVTVETDLLIAQSISCIDGKQTTDRSICKAFFPMRCSVHLESEDGVLREDVDFEIETPTGQYSFIKKTKPSHHWVSLQTTYDLRFYRFHLYVTYRRFVNDRFIFTRMKYPIETDQSWDLSCEFVSKV